MKLEDWEMIVFEVAKKHPEFLDATFRAFSAGVKSQAECNREKVCNMAAALSMLYLKPQDESARSLARTRMIESGVFDGTPFERDCLELANGAKEVL